MMMVSSRSQMKTRSRLDSGSGDGLGCLRLRFRLLRDDPSTLGSLVRRELLLGAESLLMVSGGLLLSTTGYVGLSANSTRIKKINKKSINSIFNFQKISDEEFNHQSQ